VGLPPKKIRLASLGTLLQSEAVCEDLVVAAFGLWRSVQEDHPSSLPQPQGVVWEFCAVLISAIHQLVTVD
jgi:hypothetical protein